VVNAELYKDISKAADSPSTPMMNKTDMERYNPELYNQLYGPNSPTYEVEQLRKEMKKEKERMRREMMDEMYQYTPKRKD
jgi:hypothetical protein